MTFMHIFSVCKYMISNCGDPSPDANEFAARFEQLMNVDYYQPTVLKSDES